MIGGIEGWETEGIRVIKKRWWGDRDIDTGGRKKTKETDRKEAKKTKGKLKIERKRVR